MTQQQPHPLRCETCDYQSKADYIAGRGYCLKSKKGYLTYSNNHGFTLEEYTSALGCASHSSAGKAEQRIGDVIVILQERHDDGIRLVMAQDVIALLRGEEKS